MPEASQFETKLHPVVRIHLGSSRKGEVLLHWHNSEILSDREWYYLLESHQIICIGK